jgi:diguanylate cyclase (GGDEF)-like protein
MNLRGSSRLGARVAFLGLLALTYFVTAKLGLRLAYLNPSATTVWPPSGIALAALLIGGLGLWPGIAVGAFLANLATTGLVFSSAGIAVGNTAEAIVGAALVNRFASGREAMKRPRDIFKFALLIAGASAPISASVGVGSLFVDGRLEPGTYGTVWLTWWLGDLVGALMVAPVLLLWTAEPRIQWSRGQAWEAGALLLALAMGGGAMFGGFLPRLPLIFLALPLLLWPAFRFGPRDAGSASLLLAGIAVAGTLRGLGPFARGSPDESLFQLQAFMGVNAVTTIAVAAVVREQRRLEAKLAHLADHDSLTDVLTRRRFQEELVQQLAQSRRYGTPGALLFVDLDNFKSVNDRVGHVAGDRVLASVAIALRGRLRDSDFVGRLGGDEFAVLLPRADGPQAEAAAGQLLKAISLDTVVEGKAIRVAGSIGIALISDHGGSAEELLAKADVAMFQAKSAGGNRVHLFAPEPS